MIDRITLKKLQENALKSLFSGSNGDLFVKNVKLTKVVLFYLIPLLITTIAIFKCTLLSAFANYIGVTISIFTSLFFSLIIILGDKLKKESSNSSISQKQFDYIKNNITQISQMTLYVIYLGILLVITLFLNILFKSKLYVYPEIFFTAIAFFIFVRYVIFLFGILQRLFYVNRDELENTFRILDE